eukprot:2999315-Prymnesium_polylepis.1
MPGAFAIALTTRWARTTCRGYLGHPRPQIILSSVQAPSNVFPTLTASARGAPTNSSSSATPT